MTRSCHTPKLDGADADCIRDMRTMGWSWEEIRKAFGGRFTEAQLRGRYNA